MSDLVPGWEPHFFRCLECLQQWRGWLPTNVPIPVWVAAAEALHCGQCSAGSRRIAFDLVRRREREEGTA